VEDSRLVGVRVTREGSAIAVEARQGCSWPPGASPQTWPCAAGTAVVSRTKPNGRRRMSDRKFEGEILRGRSDCHWIELTFGPCASSRKPSLPTGVAAFAGCGPETWAGRCTALLGSLLVAGSRTERGGGGWWTRVLSMPFLLAPADHLEPVSEREVALRKGRGQSVADPAGKTEPQPDWPDSLTACLHTGLNDHFPCTRCGWRVRHYQR
jgi:hypothetical protein